MGDQHSGVAVEADRAAIGAADFLCCAHDDRAMHVALLDAAARDCLLDRNNDDVANRCGPALGSAQYLDALDTACAGVVGDVEIRLHLNHAASPLFSVRCAARSTVLSTAGATPAAATTRRPLATSSGPPSTTQCFRFEI